MPRFLKAAIATVFTSVFTAAAFEAQLPVVLHAEPPADNPLARVIVTSAKVRVSVDGAGHVTQVITLVPRPPFVTKISEEAARKWLFAPSAGQHEYDLTFRFDGVGQTDIASYQQVTHEDPLTLSVRHLQSIVSEMSPVEKQAAAQRRCPVHGVHLSLGLVRIQYGLPHGYNLDDPEERKELRNARRLWRARERLFPQAFMFAGGGCNIQPERFSETAYCPLCRRA